MKNSRLTVVLVVLLVLGISARWLIWHGEGKQRREDVGVPSDELNTAPQELRHPLVDTASSSSNSKEMDITRKSNASRSVEEKSHSVLSVTSAKKEGAVESRPPQNEINDAIMNEITKDEEMALRNWITTNTQDYMQLAADVGAICLKRRLSKEAIVQLVGARVRTEVGPKYITYFFAPSQTLTINFDEQGRAATADITGNPINLPRK